MNDAVSIILFNTVMKYTAVNSVISAITPIHILGSFFSLGFNSFFIGVVFGLLSSYILKTFRAFSKSPVSESMMIFCMAYLSYVISETAHYSGIITLLTSGVVMAHYTWYNLSPQGKQSSFIVFQFLGYAIEAFVFSYLGLTFFSYGGFKWSPGLFVVELVIICIGRGLGTLGLIGLLQSCCKYKSGITLNELVFIWYAGMIRGAIAFGLVLRIDPLQFKNRDVIVTTSLSLVIFTTVVFGSTVGLLQKRLFTSHPVEFKEPKAPVNVSSATAGEGDDFASIDLTASDSSYERVLHPNEERSSKPKAAHAGCAKYLHRFDELIMKPIFIYKYERNMQKKSKEFFELFMKQGDEIEREYGQDQIQRKQMREQGLIAVGFHEEVDG